MAKRFKKIYNENLKHPKWQKKRLEVMGRDGFACKYCGDKDTTLNVHHIDYHGKPWESENKDLITCCEECHKHVLHNPDVTEIKSVEKFQEDWCTAFIVSCTDRDVLITVASDRTDTFLFAKQSNILKNIYKLNTSKK